MTGMVTKEAQVRPPLEGDILVDATSGSSAKLTITSIQGKHISIRAEGADLYYMLGDASGTASATAESGDTRTMFLAAGDTDRFEFPQKLVDNGGELVTTLTYITAGGAGFVRCWSS